MKKLLKVILVFASTSLCYAASAETARWDKHAKNVSIVRDTWGIAHVYGKTDADAVFGAEYTQAEDDFNRVETNYINALGRLAETEGEARIYLDLRMKLFIDPVDLKKQYAESPAWLKELMDAFADGLNYYLSKHPDVHPKVIQHFEPWMALSFTEGSIGGDIERTVNLNRLESFYGKTPVAEQHEEDLPYLAEPSGSNGAAIAPSHTANHHALLLINPHTSFFFRSELQMVSQQGLNAYGAVTWGQFFIYQGFNERAGWMHTSSGVDAVDEYLETVTQKNGKYFYRYGKEERPVTSVEVSVPYKTASGMASKKFTVYKTHHGPVIREADGKWVSLRLMQEPIKALTQSYTRTKAKNYKAYRETMELQANSSNNTIFADADGDIAYFHGNYIPRRDTQFDWKKPVDGSNPETEWKGLLTVDETPHLFNPKSGWLYNTNNWPWSGAGESSLKKEDFPSYVENGTESARGLHAVRVLKDKTDFTLDSLIAAAFDSYLTWFEEPLPAMIAAWDSLPAGDPLKDKTAEQIAVLRAWNLRWAADSVATSLAIYWGEDSRRVAKDRYLDALVTASDRLTADFGTWKTQWGQINRFQRLTGDIVQPFSDAGPSIPVPFTSAIWGSLASFGARQYPGTKKWYGTSGNSFVAVVEFGDKVRARAVTAGGENGSPSSKHFNDEAERYASGNLRDVYFYPADVKAHSEREYRP
jgi:acyl-homoserine-lactone acylase